ncbi:MAG: polyhydroxyalkanoic acid system family protein [Dehalococcoidia bacterium]
MKISYPHGKTMAVARELLDTFIAESLERYAGRITEPSYIWEEGTIRFSLKALAMRMRGTATVNDERLHIDMPLPLMTRPLEPEIKARIIARLDELFA